MKRRYPQKTLPTWIGNAEFHKSHKANLTRKDSEHYSKYWKEEAQSGYLWPKRKVKGKILLWQRITQTY
jgi:hypothetical protein